MGEKNSNKHHHHRGADGNTAKFAVSFIKDRLRGFEKDMRICLKPERAKDRAGFTHAYFPALMSCCGMLEYLSGLYVGRLDGLGKREVCLYAAKYFPRPEYSDEAIRVLFDAFRNAVAHRGIASGVWRDQHTAHHGRRLTWKVYATTHRPFLELKAEAGNLLYHSPWPCPYTHRVHIHVGRLWRDIRDSALKAGGYCDDLTADDALQENFERCMRDLYPT